MPLCRILDRLVLFVHIPKAGGTSIERFLAASGQIALLHGRKIRGMNMTPQHIHAAIYEKILPEQFYDYSFCVVRNPFDRLASEYIMRDASEHSFDDWVSNIFKEYAADPFIHDNHIRPQSEFLLPSIEVFRFEDGIRNILSRVALHLDLEPPTGDVHQRKSPPTQITASEETLRLIEDFYAVDLKAFGYSRENSVRFGRGPDRKPEETEVLQPWNRPAKPSNGSGKPLSIAIFVPWITKGRGGTESVGAMVANGMAERGHAVNIHTFDDGHGEPTWPLRPEISVSWHPETDSEASDSQLLMELALQAPDVIVGLHMNRACFRYVYCSYKLNCPVLLSEHTDPNFADETGVLLHAERERIFAGADRIHLLTDDFRDELPPHLQLRATVIPNTVTPARRQADPVGEEGQIKTILCVARLVPRKNVGTLVAAFARAAAADPDWQLRIVGYGAQLDPLRAQADMLGVGSRVIFEGRKENAYPFYETAQLVVLPSYAEGLPLAPLEAMAHGLPSIGFSDCSGIPILIENGVTGLHVAREDQVESLAEGIGRLMQDPALRSSMGIAAKARYDTMFAPNLVLDRWESLIQQTAAARPQSFSIKAISGAIESRVAIQSALEVGPTRYFAGMSTAAET